jgi:CHAT domain-containing protein
MSDPKKLAFEIMALVDSTPSELFSFERKQVENTISDMIYRFTQQTDDELDHAFCLGQEEGRGQAEDEYEDRITEMQEEIDELKDQLSEMEGLLDQRFAEGYETASRETQIVETLEFK